jgi:hypothetical protein
MAEQFDAISKGFRSNHNKYVDDAKLYKTTTKTKISLIFWEYFRK